jgi:hypothetical protein
MDRMQNVILLILCLAIGIGLRRFGRVPDNAHMTLNTFVIYVAFPGLPAIEAHYGKSGIATGILIDTPETYLVRAPLLSGMMPGTARLRPLSQRPRFRSGQRSQATICLVPHHTLPRT